MLPQQVIKEMQGLADDSYGSHDLHTNSQTCTAKSIRTSLNLPSSKPQGMAVVRHGRMASHHRLSGALTEASEGSLKLPRLIFKLRGGPGQALSKGQVIHLPLSLEFPAAHHWWDNHCHACRISLHLL